MIFERIRTLIYNLAVQLVEVGKPNDGVTQPLFSSGTDLDKSWTQHEQELSDAREAWRLNPMARRLIGLTTGYVVGPGMSVSSEYEPLQAFIDEFWYHPQNRMEQRLEPWSDELARAGELFIALFPNEASGVAQVRAVPASRIRKIEWKSGDYETELAYNEIAHRYSAGATIDSLQGTWWLSPAGWRQLFGSDGDAEEGASTEGAWQKAARGAQKEMAPWMLHYAVNRPLGALRGEGDLAPILTWLRRYRRWLEDRVRLNAGVRSFLWIIYAPSRLMKALVAKYSGKEPPAPGTVVVADEKERWEAVAPTLQARDASADGRAIRWMIAAGGPGTSLVDFGEGEDSNLATAKAAAELRRRFLLRRQTEFAWILADLTANAFNRYRESVGGGLREVTARDVTVARPDISSEDNASIAKALGDLVKSMAGLRDVLGDSTALRRYALRLFARYAEEPPSEDEMAEMLDGVMPDAPADDGNPDQMQDLSRDARLQEKPCAGCGDSALQDDEVSESESEAVAASFGAAVSAFLISWGADAAEAIGADQFTAWERQVEEADGDVGIVAAAVAVAVSQLDEARALTGPYAELLAGLLADYRALYGVEVDGAPFSDEAWIEERAAELKLRGGAEAGILRGLRDQVGTWGLLMAAGRFLSVDTRAGVMQRWTPAEAHNRTRLAWMLRSGESDVWVRDCMGGCLDDDVICLARADVIMPIGLASMQRLAHSRCTLNFQRTTRRPT